MRSFMGLSLYVDFMETNERGWPVSSRGRLQAPIAMLFTFLLSATALLARQAPSETPCGAGGALPRPSHDLYCIELTAVPGLDGVAGSFELGRIPGPFGVNVNRDGRQMYAPVLRLRGLPQPGRFSPGATVWVAWMATQTLTPVRKLGIVGNGVCRLGPIDWPKFLILITAEKSAAVREPSGRHALRGLSPSSRMMPPDMTQFIYGAVPVGDSARSGGSEHVHEHSEPGEAKWFHPPMPPGLPMMPAEMALPPPAATAYLPGAALEDARPREVVRLRDGDTLTLTAMPVRRILRGKAFTGFGYNGQIPGPLIWADQGSTIHVHYQNQIGWPTTVHWHGVRLDNAFDGAEGMTQAAVPVGGSFDYTLHLPDAGLYWYHPHRRDDILRDLGLAGNILVTPRRRELAPVNREELLMLDDMEVGDGGAGPVPYGTERATHALMGRFGNVMLVNGRTDWTLDVKRGDVVRFLITNAANARVFSVSFGSARIKLVGSDVSNFEREQWVRSVAIAPAERYLVDVQFPVAGKVVVENRVQAIDHVYGRFFEEVDTLGVVRVSGVQGNSVQRDSVKGEAAAFATLRAHPDVIRDIARYRQAFGKPVDKALVIRMEATNLPFVVSRFLAFDSVYFHPVEWGRTMPMMNWNATTNDVRWILEEPSTGRRNMDIHWDFTRGSLVKIRIVNLRETLHAMQHPIHFHGQRFLVLSQNGVPNTNLAWKDTFLLPAGSSADILLEASNPGMWMAHCHISEHLESGMMMGFMVH